ncbi:MAG: glycosyltransferase [Candidatus Aenigmatarchaeota archaeon]
MKIDAIMTVYNEKENLIISIPSIFNQTLPPRRLIIVDAGSTDGTTELIKRLSRKYPIRLIVKEGCNRSQGRNIAISKTSTDYILCLNADARLEKDCVENLVKVIGSSSKIGSVGAIQVYPKNQNYIAKAIWYIPGMAEISEVRIPAIMRGDVEVKNTPCECCLWRKKAVVDAGLFDEKLNWGEDPELHYRMRKKGWKILATGKARFEHFYKNTLKKFIKQQFFYGLGGFEMIIKSPRAAIEILGWKIFVFLSFLASLALIFINLSLFLIFILVGLFFLFMLSIMVSLKVLKREKSLSFFFLVFIIHFIKHFMNILGICSFMYTFYKVLKSHIVVRC